MKVTVDVPIDGEWIEMSSRAKPCNGELCMIIPSHGDRCPKVVQYREADWLHQGADYFLDIGEGFRIANQDQDPRFELYLHFEMRDNPGLTEKALALYESMYPPGVFYDRYVRGLWVMAEGLIYPDFADHPEKYVIDDAEAWLRENHKRFTVRMIGVDFGGTGSATKFQMTGITEDGYVVALDEEYIDHKKKSVDPDGLNRLFTAFVRRVTDKWGYAQTRADSAEQILIRGLFNTASLSGLKTQVLNAKKIPINDRIKLTLLLMAQGRFFVTKQCPHLIDALSTAVYDSTKLDDERLDDGTTDIDSLDAFEYSIESWYKQLESAGHIKG